jgi:hypothetical protein
VAILNCPGCGRGGLRVPDGRRGRVTCPTCGAEWFYPDCVEISEVEFRCSGSGALFIVVLSRRSSLHKFVIQAIKNAPTRTNARAQTEATHSPAAKRSIAVAPSRPLLPSRGIGWLARIANFRGELASNEHAVADQPDRGSSPPALKTYDAEQYNWSSFVCPYCNARSFMKCRGGHLACDGTVQIRNGSRFHQCFCGNAGFISGTIESFDGSHSILTIKPAPAEQTNPAGQTEVGAAALPSSTTVLSKRNLP